jgi:succinoglycan biosynthesis protein ExoO
MSPRVSVIIPTYNVESYIHQSLTSALQQTETDLEVIVIDNVSQDKTLEVIKSIQDPRLRVIVNPKNIGAAASRNYAIREATGDWIALLDADDWYAPERLEKLLEVVQIKPEADLISDDIYYINENAASPWSTLLLESNEHISDIQKIEVDYFLKKDLPVASGFYLGLTKPLIRRNFLIENKIEFDVKLKICFDFWFCLSCLVYNANFFFVPQPYYFYRSRGGSLTTADKSYQLDEFCQAGQMFLQQEVVKGDPSLIETVSERLDFIEHKIKPYYRVTDRLKKHEYWTALVLMLKNPYFFLHFGDQFVPVFMRRFRRRNQKLQAR